MNCYYVDCTFDYTKYNIFGFQIITSTYFKNKIGMAKLYKIRHYMH